jgi:hypothetical protein
MFLNYFELKYFIFKYFILIKNCAVRRRMTMVEVMKLKKMRRLRMIGVVMETLAERYVVYVGGGKERKEPPATSNVSHSHWGECKVQCPYKNDIAFTKSIQSR